LALGDDSVSESEPATTKLNYRDMKTYGNLPMQDEMAVVNCDSCQRPILASSFKKHLGKMLAGRLDNDVWTNFLRVDHRYLYEEE
jgi:hypothetical protein